MHFSSSSSDEEEALALCLLMDKRQKRKWVYETNKTCEQLGEYHRLCRELESFEDRFYIYFRMSRDQFEVLHVMLQPNLERRTTNWRRPISSRERLSICLGYLATGDTHQTIAFSFRVGRSTVSKIVKTVSKEIWNVLEPKYSPTEETWKRSELGFREIRGFHNCVGSIDGKHVRLRCPPNSGSNYFCYKSYFSIVLLAVIDPYYNFIMVDIGSYGRHSDNGIFENSAFYQHFQEGKVFPSPKPLPGTQTPVPHVLIGDEGFGLQTFLMRSFPKVVTLHDSTKKIFNKRLSRARRVVENGFGILAQKFQIFFRPIDTDVNTAVSIVQAACCFHNYIRNGIDDVNISPEESDELITQGLLPQQPTNRQANNAAFEVRQQFVNFFNFNPL